MKAYHMSETLRSGDTLEVDNQKMVLNGKYFCAVLRKFRLWEWSDYAKWSVEGAFEFIRKTEFSDAISRLKCNYFYFRK